MTFKMGLVAVAVSLALHIPSVLAQATVPVVPAVPAADNVHRMSRAEAIDEEARQIAKSLRLRPEQALVRAKAADHIGDHVSQLRERFADRIAGIYGIDDPTLKLVVRLTGTARVPREVFKADDADIPIEFEVGAKHTLADLRGIVASNRKVIDEIVPRSLGDGTDERTGELVVQVPSDTSASEMEQQKQKLSTALGIPVRLENDNGPTQRADVRGGSRVDTSTSWCTSGFTVKNTSTNVTAMSTSGHCEGVSVYYNPSQSTIALGSAQSETLSAYADVEMHSSSYTEAPEFYAVDFTNIRTVTGRRLRTSTFANDQVCHRGQTSGYSCGYVQQTDFVPKSSTGGPACGRDSTITCAPVWVRVTGGSCGGGDSGGPVFASTTAVGLLTYTNAGATGGSSCSWWAYMSLDYLPSPWAVLYGP